MSCNHCSAPCQGRLCRHCELDRAYEHLTDDEGARDDEEEATDE